jgi:ribose transport system permease protein
MVTDVTSTRSDRMSGGSVPDPGRARRGLPRLERALRGGSAVTSGVLVFYVLLSAYFWIQVPGFASYSNGVNILSTASVVLVVSLGQALAIISGGFDLSVGGIVPLGAVTFAQLTNNDWSIAPALAVTVLVGLVVGALNALLIGKFGINPLIATLGTLSITGGVAFTVANGVTLQMRPEAGLLGDPSFVQVPYLCFLAVGMAIVMDLVLRFTVFGRRIYTVGGNSQAARLAGVRIGWVLFGVYGLSGALSALAGVIAASQVLAATGDIGATTTLVSIAAVVLGGAALTGGTGGVPGTLLGVLLLATVANGMNIMRVPAFYQQIVTGAVLLLAVGFGRLQETFRDRG